MATQDPALAITDELHRIPARHAARFGWPLPPLAGGSGDPDPAPPAADPAPKAGEADPAPPADPKPAAKTDPGDDPGDDLEAWKGHSRKHEKRAKDAAARAEKAEAELEKLRNASKSDQEKALDEARKQGATETAAQFRDRIKRAEIRALAAGKFADPEDAIKLLELDDDDIFDDEGEVQTSALKTALEDLLERKPHLAATASRKPAGDADGGKGSGPADKDLEAMSVEEHLKRIRKTPA